MGLLPSNLLGGRTNRDREIQALLLSCCCHHDRLLWEVVGTSGSFCRVHCSDTTCGKNLNHQKLHGLEINSALVCSQWIWSLHRGGQLKWRIFNDWRNIFYIIIYRLVIIKYFLGIGPYWKQLGNYASTCSPTSSCPWTCPSSVSCPWTCPSLSPAPLPPPCRHNLRLKCTETHHHRRTQACKTEEEESWSPTIDHLQ